MKEIDWSKAPEGAMYARKHSGGVDWYKREEGSWLYLNPIDRWEIAYLTSEIDCEKRPEWTSQGLPPVGTVCEWNYGGHAEWYVAKILYIGSVYMIVSSNDGEQHYYLRDIRFRPIRSSWQIAEQDRQESVSEMLGIFKFSDDKQEMLRATCFALYDAGYRKQEQPK